LRNVTPGKDFFAEYFDLRETVAGDTCIQCGGIMEHVECIEIGRAGKVEDSSLTVLDSSGEEVPVRMASYELFLERILCAVIEISRDDNGMILPPSIAPFDVIVTPVNVADTALSSAALRIYEQCRKAGFDPLLDDRDERPGLKFKDADLIGIPFRITVGKKIAQGIVEVMERRTKSTEEVEEGQAAALIAAKLCPSGT
jgi:prolyl-tRNA synthetase